MSDGERVGWDRFMVLVAPELWMMANEKQKEFVRVSRVALEDQIEEALGAMKGFPEAQYSVEAGRIYAEVISGMVYCLSMPYAAATFDLRDRSQNFLGTFFQNVLEAASDPDEPNLLIALMLTSLLDMALAEPLARYQNAKRKRALREPRRRPEESI